MASFCFCSREMLLNLNPGAKLTKGCVFACNKPNLKFLIFFIGDTYLGTVSLCIHFFFLLGLFYFAIARVEVSAGKHTATSLFTEPGHKSSCLSKPKLFKQLFEQTRSMRYTRKDPKQALKVGGLGCIFFFFLFNRALLSLLVTAGEALGEEEGPRHSCNEVFLHFATWAV